MKVFPTKFEIYEDDEPMAQITAFDECVATVTISTSVNAHIWKELSEEIYNCLIAMKLEGDEISEDGFIFMLDTVETKS